MKKNIIRRQVPDIKSNHFDGLHPVLKRVYASRHIQTVDQIETNLDSLIPYQSLMGLEQAVPLIANAIINQKRILIVGDFDADGATSTAVAIRALKSFGAKHVSFLVPNRFAFGYGLTPELVAAAKDHAPEMIITVDNGIANHAGVEAAKQLGIEVVVTDHHLAAPTLPCADAIVNPNQPGDIFPSKNLAGVGVIFYVMLALRRHLQQINWFEQSKIPEPNMSRLLDLVALGTVADLVPLDRNNRVLVHQGLRRIRAGQCSPAIVALLEFAGRDFRRAMAADLGFAVAARLNAAGRLDDMSLGIECLLCDDSTRVREMAAVLDQLNDERKHIEQGMQAQALNALEKLSENLKKDLPRGLCLFDASWHQGVIGILASRIKDRFHRPVIVFAPGQENELKGSARSISGLHVRDVLAKMDVLHPGLIMKFGGHAMAAGMTIQKSNLDTFKRVFDEIVSQHLSESDLQHSLLTDGELEAKDFSLELASMLREGGPWGQAFPEPTFDSVFRIVEQRIVGDKHLKLKLSINEKIVDAIAFFIDTQIWPNHRCEQIRAVFRLDINEYKERFSVQLILDYLEPA